MLSNDRGYYVRPNQLFRNPSNNAIQQLTQIVNDSSRGKGIPIQPSVKKIIGIKKNSSIDHKQPLCEVPFQTNLFAQFSPDSVCDLSYSNRSNIQTNRQQQSSRNQRTQSVYTLNKENLPVASKSPNLTKRNDKIIYPPEGRSPIYSRTPLQKFQSPSGRPKSPIPEYRQMNTRGCGSVSPLRSQQRPPSCFRILDISQNQIQKKQFQQEEPQIQELVDNLKQNILRDIQEVTKKYSSNTPKPLELLQKQNEKIKQLLDFKEPIVKAPYFDSNANKSYGLKISDYSDEQKQEELKKQRYLEQQSHLLQQQLEHIKQQQQSYKLKQQQFVTEQQRVSFSHENQFKQQNASKINQFSQTQLNQANKQPKQQFQHFNQQPQIKIDQNLSISEQIQQQQQISLNTQQQALQWQPSQQIQKQDQFFEQCQQQYNSIDQQKYQLKFQLQQEQQQQQQSQQQQQKQQQQQWQYQYQQKQQKYLEDQQQEQQEQQEQKQLEKQQEYSKYQQQQEQQQEQQVDQYEQSDQQQQKQIAYQYPSSKLSRQMSSKQSNRESPKNVPSVNQQIVAQIEDVLANVNTFYNQIQSKNVQQNEIPQKTDETDEEFNTNQITISNLSSITPAEVSNQNKKLNVSFESSMEQQQLDFFKASDCRNTFGPAQLEKVLRSPCNKFNFTYNQNSPCQPEFDLNSSQKKKKNSPRQTPEMYNTKESPGVQDLEQSQGPIESDVEIISPTSQSHLHSAGSQRYTNCGESKSVKTPSHKDFELPPSSNHSNRYEQMMQQFQSIKNQTKQQNIVIETKKSVQINDCHHISDFIIYSSTQRESVQAQDCKKKLVTFQEENQNEELKIDFMQKMNSPNQTLENTDTSYKVGSFEWKSTEPQKEIPEINKKLEQIQKAEAIKSFVESMKSNDSQSQLQKERTVSFSEFLKQKLAEEEILKAEEEAQKLLEEAPKIKPYQPRSGISFLQYKQQMEN